MRAKILVLMMVAAVGFAACQGKGGPEKAAETFLNSLGKADFDTAKKYATKDTKKILTLLESFGKDKIKEKLKKEGHKDISIKSCDVQGDTADCKYDTPKGEKSITMKKVDGNWKAHMDKNKGKKKKAPKAPKVPSKDAK